jgi:hypothetical protein
MRLSWIRIALVLASLWIGGRADAHDVTAVTHEFGPATMPPGPKLRVAITDPRTGKFLAARFTVRVNGRPYLPDAVDGHGIVFVSTHRTKHENFTVTYARGDGPVSLSLPAGARTAEVTAVRGFEYRPATATVHVEADQADVELALDRWSDLSAAGWIAADEHLHYDRVEPGRDPTWLTMLDADGLTEGHFLTLKGGMMPGVWARQPAYGAAGEATDGVRVIVPGEEYRDAAQGHVNLLGVDALIEPIRTGGAEPNYPPLHDVLIDARQHGAMTGVAHGGTLGQQPTAIADAVLGTVDFWEISNGFIYYTETWYRLMNCGYFLPPAAGTDLPNSPFREPWQPFFGAVRTYVQTGGRTDFVSFKSALARGRVFITGGPLIEFTVDGRGAGETIALPSGGGDVLVRAEISSAQGLRELHLVRNGIDIANTTNTDPRGEINRQIITQRVHFAESGWLVAWGKGERIPAQNIDALAHSGAIQVIVGGRPVRVRADCEALTSLLTKQRDYYWTKGRYAQHADRQHVREVFERALGQLK